MPFFLLNKFKLPLCVNFEFKLIKNSDGKSISIAARKEFLNCLAGKYKQIGKF
jgi:hypothetical protein